MPGMGAERAHRGIEVCGGRSGSPRFSLPLQKVARGRPRNPDHILELFGGKANTDFQENVSE